MSRTKTNKDRREIVVAADVAVVHVAVVLDVIDVVVVDVVRCCCFYIAIEVLMFLLPLQLPVKISSCCY